jgi:hypothetical protein
MLTETVVDDDAPPVVPGPASVQVAVAVLMPVVVVAACDTDLIDAALDSQISLSPILGVIEDAEPFVAGGCVMAPQSQSLGSACWMLDGLDPPAALAGGSARARSMSETITSPQPVLWRIAKEQSPAPPMPRPIRGLLVPVTVLPLAVKVPPAITSHGLFAQAKRVQPGPSGLPASGHAQAIPASTAIHNRQELVLSLVPAPAAPRKYALGTGAARFDAVPTMPGQRIGAHMAEALERGRPLAQPLNTAAVAVRRVQRTTHERVRGEGASDARKAQPPRTCFDCAKVCCYVRCSCVLLQHQCNDVCNHCLYVVMCSSFQKLEVMDAIF